MKFNGVERKEGDRPGLSDEEWKAREQKRQLLREEERASFDATFTQDEQIEKAKILMKKEKLDQLNRNLERNEIMDFKVDFGSVGSVLEARIEKSVADGDFNRVDELVKEMVACIDKIKIKYKENIIKSSI